MLSAVHTELAEKDLLPEHHLVDWGYITIANLIQSQAGHDVDLVGPPLKTHWYQAETGYDLTHFTSDWEAEPVTSPQGRMSSSWTPVQDAGKSLIKVKFSAAALVRSALHGTPAQEPRAARSPCLHGSRCRRCLPRESREETDAFKDAYRHRAGIEGTHWQAVRALGLRRSRSIGRRKTHLSHVSWRWLLPSPSFN